MKILSYIMVVSSLFLAGCSVLPNPGPLAGKEVKEIDRSIVDGKTTSSELLSIYDNKVITETTPQGKKVLNWYRGWSSGFTQTMTVLSVLAENDIVVKHVVLRYNPNTDYSFVSKLSDDDLKSFIIPGKTTRLDVENKYGKPNDNSFDDDSDQVLVYRYADSSRSKYGWIPNVGGFAEALAGDVKTNVKVLKVLIDKQNIVKSYQRKTINYQQGIGLLNSSDVEEVK